MPGVDHLDLVVTDLERSLAFYTELLGPLGFTETSEIVGERGERVIYISGAGDPAVSLREAQVRRPRGPVRPLRGRHPPRRLRRRRARAGRRACRLAARAGAEIESGPEEYDYAPGYYAVFFYDPDGLKLEIVHRP